MFVGLRTFGSYGNAFPRHLGSFLEENGGLMKEARHREQSALNAFAPLAFKIFGSRSVSQRRRINLGKSLVLSRLLYNVHIWSEFSGRPRAVLYRVYMRLYRRILHGPRCRDRKRSDRLGPFRACFPHNRFFRLRGAEETSLVFWAGY